MSNSSAEGLSPLPSAIGRNVDHVSLLLLQFLVSVELSVLNTADRVFLVSCSILQIHCSKNKEQMKSSSGFVSVLPPKFRPFCAKNSRLDSNLSSLVTFLYFISPGPSWRVSVCVRERKG